MTELVPARKPNRYKPAEPRTTTASEPTHAQASTLPSTRIRARVCPVAPVASQIRTVPFQLPVTALTDPRVQALARRHLTDLPAAQLAVTIGGCFLLSEDPDLCDIPRLGFSAWLKVTHAAANETEVEAVYVAASIPFNVVEATARAAYRRMAAASAGTKLAVAGMAALVVIGGLWWVRSGRAEKFFERAQPMIRELGQPMGRL